MTFFPYIASDPKRSELMGKFMTAIYGPVGARIASGYAFERFQSLMDIGGAQGHMLVHILQRHPL
jgi:hypothetical protein